MPKVNVGLYFYAEQSHLNSFSLLSVPYIAGLNTAFLQQA